MKLELNATVMQVEVETDEETMIFHFKDVGTVTLYSYRGLGDAEKRVKFIAQKCHKIEVIKKEDGKLCDLVDGKGNPIHPIHIPQFPPEILFSLVDKFLSAVEAFLKKDDDTKKNSNTESSKEDSSDTSSTT